MVMDYIQRFIKAYLNDGLTEVMFEDLSNKYKPMYAEIRRKNPDDLELWFENPTDTGTIWHVLDAEINQRGEISGIRVCTSGMLHVPFAVRDEVQALWRNSNGWIICYIDGR